METQYTHHPVADNFYFYLFLILGAMLLVVVVYAAIKIDSHFERRRANKDDYPRKP